MREIDKDKKLNIIRPFTPPINELLPYLERILTSRQLTNDGPVHTEFEYALCEYLGTDHICLTSSGTMALILALRSLDLKGEIITTPFTSIATAQAVYWNSLKPVFVDINESDLNISIAEIENAITEQTSAILPVHVYGNPCELLEISRLAEKHNLKVVYDAAHCFGVQLNSESICKYGDLSILSFHATKVFNCLEGGAIICRDNNTREQINALKNSGIDSNRNVAGYGLNAKMNEIQSAFGLVQLKYVDGVIENRKAATFKYRELLKSIKGIRMIEDMKHIRHNYSYFPIIIDPEIFGASRDEVVSSLEHNYIFPRNYFSPLVSDTPQFSKYKKLRLPVAEKMSKNVICLPLFHDISTNEIQRVVDVLTQI